MLRPNFLLRTLAAVALGSLALPSCSGSGMTPSTGSVNPPTATLPAAAQPTTLSQRVAPDFGGTTALYVSDSWGKSVFRFVRNADGTLQEPAGSSLVVSYIPGAISVGPGGRLFVTSQNNQTLQVYPPLATGYTPAQRTLTLPFLPTSVAVDRNGYQYIGGLTNGYVAVYAPGARGTAKTIQRIALPDRHPTINGVAVDKDGNLYVSDTNEICEFATPTTNPTLVRAIVGTGQQNAPVGLAIGGQELYAANSGDANILAYGPTANGKSPPDRTISSTSPSLITPLGLAVTRNVLYSTSGSHFNGPGSVFVLNALKGSQAPIQVVTGSYLASPVSAALGP